MSVQSLICLCMYLCRRTRDWERERGMRTKSRYLRGWLTLLLKHSCTRWTRNTHIRTNTIKTVSGLQQHSYPRRIKAWRNLSKQSSIVCHHWLQGRATAMAGLIVRRDMREPFQGEVFHASVLSSTPELAAYTDFADALYVRLYLCIWSCLLSTTYTQAILLCGMLLSKQRYVSFWTHYSANITSLPESFLGPCEHIAMVTNSIYLIKHMVLPRKLKPYL